LIEFKVNANQIIETVLKSYVFMKLLSSYFVSHKNRTESRFSFIMVVVPKVLPIGGFKGMAEAELIILEQSIGSYSVCI
jgi:hypothetical protein